MNEIRHQSIKTKLSLAIVGTILIMIFMIIVAILIWYEGFYLSRQQDLLTSGHSEINWNVSSEEELMQQIFLMENRDSLNFLILDKDENIRYSTSKLFASGQSYYAAYRMPQNFSFQKSNLKNNMGAYIIIETINEFSNTENIHLVSSFKIGDNFYYVIIEKVIANVRTDIVGIILFLVICILPMGLVSSIVASKVSGFLISPILELTRISDEIAHFNFDIPIDVMTNDEIGVLASNVQILSNELKSKFDELERQNQMLEDSIKEKDKHAKIQREFISNVSHELKTPITLILGYSEALKMDIDEATKKEYMEIIIAESHKMNNLISDMLDISRLQSGDKQLVKETFDFSKLVNKMIKKHQIIFEKNNIDLSTNVAENCIISGDVSKLELVLSNFFVNANRYVDENKKIKISLVDNGDHYLFKIFNTSPKLKPEDLKKIWGSFYKVDKAHSREKGGTGIGLYLVKIILELHNFDYGVANTHNGVEFHIKIQK